MKFALGGSHDGNNTQTANELIADILDESVYAEEVGRYSAWVHIWGAQGDMLIN